MHEHEDLIVGLLAETDAAFLPIRGQRQWDGTAPCNCSCRPAPDRRGAFADGPDTLMWSIEVTSDGTGSAATPAAVTIAPPAGILVSEWCLTDKPGVDGFFDVELIALPALLRGWVESNGDTKGHAYYSLTALGVEMLQSGSVSPGKRPAAASSVSADRYHETRLAARNRLETAEAVLNAEQGNMPASLSGGVWLEDLEKEQADDTD